MIASTNIPVTAVNASVEGGSDQCDDVKRGGAETGVTPGDGSIGQHDTDTESARSSHSSVLVDMGKVVGLLRSYPHDHFIDDDEEDIVASESDFELSDENFLSESPESSTARICASCALEYNEESEAQEDSLLGDPLVYATFVAPVQQYSTETEPSRQPSFNSRQPSFNSRQPSFKQNSAEADQSVAGPEVHFSSIFFFASNAKLFTLITDFHWQFINLFYLSNGFHSKK